MSYQPIVCTLTTKDAASQALDWATLGRAARFSESIPGGVAITFPADRAADVEDLAAREAACCGFLSLTIDNDGDVVRLTITSDNPDAVPVIDVLATMMDE